MTVDFQSLTSAQTEIAILKRLNTRFFEHLAVYKEHPIADCPIAIDGNTVSVSALGTCCTAQPRAVAVKEKIVAVEYLFKVAQPEGAVPVWGLYLDANGALYLDPEFTNHLCNVDNRSMPQHLVAEIAKALLRSPIFLPQRV